MRGIYLIASTQILQGTLNVYSIRDFGRLLFNSDKNVASLVIESLFTAIIANLLDGLTDDFLIIKSSLRRDFSENHYHARLGGGLAGNF